MWAGGVMARAWSCFCRLLLFLIFLLPPPAAPGQPAGECAGAGRAGPGLSPAPRSAPRSLSRTAPFPLPRSLRGSGPPTAWPERGSCPLAPGAPRRCPVPAGGSGVAAPPVPGPACSCSGMLRRVRRNSGAPVSGPWDSRRGADPGSGLGSCHACPSSWVSHRLFAPPSRRVRSGRVLPGAPPALAEREAKTWHSPERHRAARPRPSRSSAVGQSRPAGVPRDVEQDSVPPFCVPLKHLFPCCP